MSRRASTSDHPKYSITDPKNYLNVSERRESDAATSLQLASPSTSECFLYYRPSVLSEDVILYESIGLYREAYQKFQESQFNQTDKDKALRKVLHSLKIYPTCELKSINTFNEFLRVIILERLGFYFLKDVFNWIDSDEDGLINVSELSLALQDIGENVVENEVIEMFRLKDHNRDGQISYTEFETSYRQICDEIVGKLIRDLEIEKNTGCTIPEDTVIKIKSKQRRSRVPSIAASSAFGVSPSPSTFSTFSETAPVRDRSRSCSNYPEMPKLTINGPSRNERFLSVGSSKPIRSRTTNNFLDDPRKSMVNDVIEEEYDNNLLRPKFNSGVASMLEGSIETLKSFGSMEALAGRRESLSNSSAQLLTDLVVKGGAISRSGSVNFKKKMRNIGEAFED